MRAISARSVSFQCPIHAADYGFQTGHHDVFVDADAVESRAVGEAQIDIGDGGGVGAVAHGLFAVVADIKRQITVTVHSIN